MSEPIKVVTASVTEISPELLAHAFWKMDTGQQAAFFKALANETLKQDKTYRSYGEDQWCWMIDEIKKDKEAYNQYMALSAFAFDFWPQKPYIWGWPE